MEKDEAATTPFAPTKSELLSCTVMSMFQIVEHIAREGGCYLICVESERLRCQTEQLLMISFL